MTPYEQKVRERAVEFAKEYHKGSWLGEDDFIVAKWVHIARLSLHREAEAYRNGWVDRGELAGLSSMLYAANDKLQSLGLVP